MNIPSNPSRTEIHVTWFCLWNWKYWKFFGVMCFVTYFCNSFCAKWFHVFRMWLEKPLEGEGLERSYKFICNIHISFALIWNDRVNRDCFLTKVFYSRFLCLHINYRIIKLIPETQIKCTWSRDEKAWSFLGAIQLRRGSTQFPIRAVYNHSWLNGL